MIIKIMYRIFLIKPIAFFGKKCYYISIKDNRVDSGEYGAVKYGSQCRSYGELNCGRIRKLLCPFRIPLLHIYPRKKLRYAGIMYCASVFIRRCFFMQKNKKTKGGARIMRAALLRLTACAMMIALAILLCRLLGFPQTGAYRVEISFLPIAVVAMMFGPVWAGASYGIADLLGAAVTTGINPFITLCKVAFGAAMGFAFYKKKPGIIRTVVFYIVAGLVIDIGMMSLIFIYGFGYSVKAALGYRLIGFAVNTPVRILLMILTCKYLMPLISQYGKKLERGGGFASYANGFQAVPRLGLDRIRMLMDMLGNPQDKLHCIHVAGTNGKGSVCAFAESILEAAGYRVGKYISPNLLCVNERITLCGKEISDSELNGLFRKIEKCSRKIEKKTGEQVSQFEIWTAAAFMYFAEHECDYVVLETGLGGEFDATNVISRNTMAVLTQIDLDHMKLLGDTVEKIAATKSKIIKAACESGVTVVTGQKQSVIDVIAAQAQACGTRLVVSGEAESEGFTGIYERFSYRGMEHLQSGLGGIYQVANACTAIEIALALNIDEKYIREGLSKAKNPARFEIIGENPTEIYDGAHNPNGIRALAASMERYFPNTDRTVVFACMRDKDFMPSLHMLDDGRTKFIFTTVQNNERAMGAAELCEAAKAGGIAGEYRDDLKSAIAAAEKNSSLILICGSLYLYKDRF